MGDIDIFQILEAKPPAHCDVIVHPRSGLRAILILDDLTLGPAAGGIRTQAYGSIAEALDDALELAAAMTVKCALAGLPAGGGKMVVLDHPGLDRARAFSEIGRRVDELGGAFRTAGDLGTTHADLMAASLHTRFVHLEEDALAAAAGVGVRHAIEAALEVAGRGALADVRVAVQGCGAMGRAVAQELSRAGAHLVLCDVDTARASALADKLGAEVCPAESFFDLDVDVLSPCAAGGVLGQEQAARLRAVAVVGAANRILRSPDVEDVLVSRKVLFVPDPVSSAGAVIAGIGRTIMDVADPLALVDRVRGIASDVLEDARRTGRRATDVAREMAWARIERARAERG